MELRKVFDSSFKFVVPVSSMNQGFTIFTAQLIKAITWELERWMLVRSGVFHVNKELEQ